MTLYGSNSVWVKLLQLMPGNNRTREGCTDAVPGSLIHFDSDRTVNPIPA
jgi:hypothetical protein